MSIFTLIGTVTSISDKKGFAFVSTEKGSVFVPPNVFELHSSNLVVGAEVGIRFDDEVWNEGKGTFGCRALEIYEVKPPEVHVVMARLVHFDSRHGGKLKVVGSSEFGVKLLVSKAVFYGAGLKHGRQMPIEASVVRSGDEWIVIGVKTGRDVLEAVNKVEAAAESSDTAAPDSVADIPPEDLAEIAEMSSMTEMSFTASSDGEAKAA